MEAQSIGSMIKILSETIGQKVNKNCKEFNLTMQQMKILHFYPAPLFHEPPRKGSADLSPVMFIFSCVTAFARGAAP